MRLKTVGYNIGATIAIAPYEYAKPAGYAEVELDQGDDLAQAAALARNVAVRAFLTSLDDTVQIMETDQAAIFGIRKRAKLIIGE